MAGLVMIVCDEIHSATSVDRYMYEANPEKIGETGLRRETMFHSLIAVDQIVFNILDWYVHKIRDIRKNLHPKCRSFPCQPIHPRLFTASVAGDVFAAISDTGSDGTAAPSSGTWLSLLPSEKVLSCRS